MLECFRSPAKGDLLPTDGGGGVVRPLRPPWLRARHPLEPALIYVAERARDVHCPVRIADPQSSSSINHVCNRPNHRSGAADIYLFMAPIDSGGGGSAVVIFYGSSASPGSDEHHPAPAALWRLCEYAWRRDTTLSRLTRLG